MPHPKKNDANAAAWEGVKAILVNSAAAILCHENRLFFLLFTRFDPVRHKIQS